MGSILLSDPARYAESRRIELHEVTDRLLHGRQFVLGGMVGEFESAFASYVGTRHCITVASGTDAIEIALRALACEGREVLVVANAGGYGTISCLAIGAIPIFVDIEKTSLLVSIDSVVDLVSERTGAIVVTHLFGLAVDCTKIDKSVRAKLGRSVPIIEDCAQAHGAKVGKIRAGAQATIACFSFYPTKNLGALGDGGAITTNDNELAERVKQLRQYGWTQRYFQGVSGGRNSRLDELQAGFLTVFLRDLDERNDRRRKIVKKYVEHGATVVQGNFALSERYVAHLAVCTVKNRDAFIDKFANLGISTGVHYPYLDSEFATTQHLAKQLLPNSIAVKDKIVTLPCFPEMTSLELELVCSTITQCQQHFEVL